MATNTTVSTTVRKEKIAFGAFLHLHGEVGNKVLENPTRYASVSFDHDKKNIIGETRRKGGGTFLVEFVGEPDEALLLQSFVDQVRVTVDLGRKAGLDDATMHKALDQQLGHSELLMRV